MHITRAGIAGTAGAAVLLLLLTAWPAHAGPFTFSTGNLDGRMASVSRPSSAFGPEVETADDFVLTDRTFITSATFTGLITGNSPISSIGQVLVEIYRVFPEDSNVGRTTGAPLFSTPNVPTRVNSPSDVEFDDRDSVPGTLSFTTTDLGRFAATNSVQPGGINQKPNQTTGGNGGVAGEEVQFSVTFNTPLILPADHYFFVPQVEVTNGNGAFYWLSAVRPIAPPGTPFPSGFTDLQSWTRDGVIDPDWLRIGTDIVGGNPAPTFNGAFSLTGETVPEPASLSLLGLGLAGTRVALRRRMKRS